VATEEEDRLASILASVIASNRTRAEISAETELPEDQVDAAVNRLLADKLLVTLNGQHFHVAQPVCAGPCSRAGRSLRGHEVVINPSNFRWMCAPCWGADTAENLAAAMPPAAPPDGGTGG
jgi:hypothetical protein